MSAAATVSQTRPIVRFWSKGKRPEEQGYTFDNVSLSLSDMTGARSFVELQNKGVPATICNEARRAGFMPSEIEDYLEEIE